jgi:hypothetical protein
MKISRAQLHSSSLLYPWEAGRGSSETLVRIYQTARRHGPEHHTILTFPLARQPLMSIGPLGYCWSVVVDWNRPRLLLLQYFKPSTKITGTNHYVRCTLFPIIRHTKYEFHCLWENFQNSLNYSRKLGVSEEHIKRIFEFDREVKKEIGRRMMRIQQQYGRLRFLTETFSEQLKSNDVISLGVI